MKVASIDYKKVNIADEITLTSATDELVKLYVLDNENIIFECNQKFKYFEVAKASLKDPNQDQIPHYFFYGESFGKTVDGKIYVNGWLEINFEGLDKPLTYTPTTKKAEVF